MEVAHNMFQPEKKILGLKKMISVWAKGANTKLCSPGGEAEAPILLLLEENDISSKVKLLSIMKPVD